MVSQHGEFIWYELMTRDPETAEKFYGDVIGWRLGDPMAGDIEYRLIMAGDEAIGGMLRLTDDMCEHGARPAWVGYVGVDDVDATVDKLQSLGGSCLMPAKDIPDVGRLAMVADPEGVPFYVMRGAVEDGVSTAFRPDTIGHCCWNELTTRDQEAALTFYGELFGWTSSESMSMGEMGDYRFLDHNGARIGAVSPHMKDGPQPNWRYYFYVPDVSAAQAKVPATGGETQFGPHEIPGGDFILLGADPDGAGFALVGPQKT